MSSMRLGLLGPAEGDLSTLRNTARFLLEERQVDRAIYLGRDRALDDVVAAWATDLVGEDPTDDALWVRAADRCTDASPEEIRSFLRAELDRRELARLEVLPGVGSRSVELLNGKVVVLIYDKAHLDEEDIVAASLLVFGKSTEMMMKQVGPRWFLSPGNHGAMILEDRDDGIHLTVLDADLRELSAQPLELGRGTRMRVQGAG